MLSSYWLIIYVVAFIAIFYFMAIRPQQRQRRAHQELLASLKKGDQIVTASGIYGKVTRIEDNVVVIEVAKGVTMKVARRAVAEIMNRSSAEAKAALPEGPSRSSTSRRSKRATAEVEEAVADEDEEADEEDPWSKDIWKKD